MNWLKKYWKEIIIVLLIIFGLNKCTQSCSKSSEIDKQKIELQYKDSLLDQSKFYIQSLNDSIIYLNNTIKIYEEKVSGLNQALSIQDEAAKRITEAKQNINVTVKEKK